MQELSNFGEWKTKQLLILWNWKIEELYTAMIWLAWSTF